ncbi:uncharacterized protein ACA1_215650 [Acanthamoeba castellanii str. Neff]|uniref:Uncharacterized protein n=1 Tax=Acanthamoeba castellanii (strain ATCC 30010 / Neff) TaxID=1257118 RepID=L8GPM0_ACACF|nr:uncharacterized protein ACA1_215650 [Acanthamoeba castellanii str. Neff]ELR15094.1 hypothetical protein ACA1_215650 [Acanthamoeba castellanii str. Neff]
MHHHGGHHQHHHDHFTGHHHHHQHHHPYAPPPHAPVQTFSAGGAPYENQIQVVHHHHHLNHGGPGQVRVKMDPSCFGAGAFPEYVPNEIRGRVADGDYVAHVRRLNHDLAVAARWGWGVLLCVLGVVGAFIGFAVSMFTAFNDVSNFKFPSAGALWPWGLLFALSFVGIVVFAIISAVKSKAVLREHEQLFNEGLGRDAGLAFRFERKIKEIKHAKERWDPVLKKHVKPKTAKVTMIIDIIGEPTTTPVIPHSLPEIVDNPQLVMV